MGSLLQRFHKGRVMRLSPVSESASSRATLASMGMLASSICIPSRMPSSVYTISGYRPDIYYSPSPMPGGTRAYHNSFAPILHRLTSPSNPCQLRHCRCPRIMPLLPGLGHTLSCSGQAQESYVELPGFDWILLDNEHGSILTAWPNAGSTTWRQVEALRR